MLSAVLKQYGTLNIDDILFISFGQDYLDNILKDYDEDSDILEKYFIIKKYIKPIKYKIISWTLQNRNNIEKNNTKSVLLQDIYIAETSNTFDIENISKISNSSLTLQLFGVKIVFQNEKKKQTMILTGIIENIPLEYINNDFVDNKYKLLETLKPEDNIFDSETFDTFKKSLSLKDILVNSCNDLYELLLVILPMLNKLRNNPFLKLHVNLFIRHFLNNVI